jgi:hypothetical protein
MPKRIEPFFPDDYRMWIFLSRLGFLQRAHHLVAYGAMYRWHPGGIYPGSDWNPRVLEPGDLFVAEAPLLPPGTLSEWKLLPGPGPFRAWLLER